MGRFKRPQPLEARAESFIAGADERRPVARPAPSAELDPGATPTHGFLLRINKYEAALIKELAAREERSQQQALRRWLFPALERHLQGE